MATYYPRARANLSVVFDGFGSADQPFALTDLVPQSFSVTLNSYKEADTWEITFNSLAFPFSPELIRSCAVEIYAYEVSAQTEDTNWTDPANLLVTGLVDEVQLSQEDGGTVTMTGRDYTALLLDRQWDPTTSGHRGRVPAGMPLDKCVQFLVDQALGASAKRRTLTVEMLDLPLDPVTGRVSKTISSKKETIKTASTKSRSRKKGIVVRADQSYWDTIYKLCLSYGYIVFVQGHKVIISKPQVLQADAADRLYRVAYGRNLKTLTAQRKLAKEATPQIRVRAWSPKERRSIEGRYPEGRDLTVTGVGTRKEEYVTMTAGDTNSESELKEMAKTAYFAKSRGEGSISFTTKHLRDLPERPGGPTRSLLALRAGDPVYVQWDAFNSELMLDTKIPDSDKVARLIGLGYSAQVASVVAANYAKLDYFRQPFYARTVKVSWSAEQGMAFDVEAMNFINVARDGKVTDA